MNSVFIRRTCACFTALIFTMLHYAHAQMAMAIDTGQETGTGVMLAPPGGPAQIGVITTRAGFAFKENAETVKDQPYQAQATTEIKQTLADGSHIVQNTTANVARDSEGRTVRTQKLNTIGPWKSKSDSSEGNATTLTSIFDPVAKTHIDYTSDTKVAHVLPLPPDSPSGAPTTIQAQGFSTGPSPTPGANMTFAVQSRIDSSASEKAEDDAKTEALGTKTIDGIQVTGTRTLSTIPAGAIGNEKDIVIKRETWYSPELKLVIQSTQDDPRFGETTYSLTNIQRNEPDETLFQIPAGYKVEKPHIVVNSHPQ